MTSHLMLNRMDNVSTSSSEYGFLCGVALNTSTRTIFESLISTGGKIKNLQVTLDAAPGEGKSIAVTLYKNGSPTSLVVTISDTDTTGENTSDEVSVVAEDLVCFQTTPSETPASSDVMCSTIFEPTVSDENIYFGSYTYDALDTTDTEYARIHGITAAFGGSGGGFFTDSGETLLYFPVAGTLKKFYGELRTAPGSEKSRTFTIGKNGSPTDLTFTISDAATTGNDTSNTAAISAGDYVWIKCEATSTPAASGAMFGLVFVPTVSGQSILLSAVTSSPTATFKDGALDNGEDRGFSASIRSVEQRMTSQLKFTKMNVWLKDAPGAETAYQFIVRDDGASTDLDVTISDTDTSGSYTGDVQMADYSDTVVRGSLTGSPAATYVYYSFILGAAASASTKTITADSHIVAESTNTITADTHILNSETQTITSDSHILNSESDTITADSHIIKNDNQFTITADSHIKTIEQQTITADSHVKTSDVQKTLNADSHILKEATSTITSDSVVCTEVTSTIDSDSHVMKSGVAQTITADSVISGAEQKTITADSHVLKIGDTGTITSDSHILNENSDTINSDSHIKASTSNTITADSHILETKSDTSLTSDSHVNAPATQTITADSHIFATESETITSFSFIKGPEEIQNIFSYSHIFLPDNQKNITSDSVIKREETKTLTSSSHVLRTERDNITSQSHIFDYDIQETINSDSHIKRIEQNTSLTSDSHILESKQSNINSNSHIVNLDNETTITSSSHIKRTVGIGEPVITDDLVLYWKCNDDNATKEVLDSSGNGYNGTSIIDTTETMSVAGKVNKGLSIGDNINYILHNYSLDGIYEPNNSTLQLSNNHTISMWVSPNLDNFSSPNSGHADWSRLLDKDAYQIAPNSSSKQILYQILNSVGTPFLTYSNVQDWYAGQWYHIVCRMENGYMTMYVNNVLQSDDDTMTGTLKASGQTLVMGNNGSLNRVGNAIFDEVMLFNRALSTTEISELYSSGANALNSSSYVLNQSTEIINSTSFVTTVNNQQTITSDSYVTVKVEKTLTANTHVTVSPRKTITSNSYVEGMETYTRTITSDSYVNKYVYLPAPKLISVRYAYNKPTLRKAEINIEKPTLIVSEKTIEKPTLIQGAQILDKPTLIVSDVTLEKPSTIRISNSLDKPVLIAGGISIDTPVLIKGYPTLNKPVLIQNALTLSRPVIKEHGLTITKPTIKVGGVKIKKPIMR